MAEGVVWVPDESVVRAGTDGFVQRLVAEPGAAVQPGDALFLCEHPRLQAELLVLAARVKELEARRTEQRPVDLVKAAIIEEELAYARDQLARVRRRIDDLVIRSRTTGTFIVPAPQDLPGRFVKQGEMLAHVVDLHQLTVRTAVLQGDIDLVRGGHNRVELRLAERLVEPLSAEITRIVPAALDELPSAALGTQGGGAIAVDPTDSKGVKAMFSIFQIDLSAAAGDGLVNAGGRVHVRFSHPWTPLSEQWYRQLRQLFLTRFNV
jgi:putative peptide zinc metalloprotease protein